MPSPPIAPSGYVKIGPKFKLTSLMCSIDFLSLLQSLQMLCKDQP